MIISASRRTDLPAFYARWFINRVRAGYCLVPNPFNPRQISRISLAPEDVDVIVFWTRHARPLFPYLQELDERGYRYYFQYTLMDNPRALDTRTPSLEVALDTFRELARRIGPQRVIWRYDPIVLSTITPPEFHAQAYARIVQALRGYTRRSVVSLMDPYRKSERRLRALAGQGIKLVAAEALPQREFDHLMHSLVDSARNNDLQITSCAEEIDLRGYGIQPGKCVDDDYIRQVFGIEVTHSKDPTQRAACGCVVSRDIGAYDTCPFECQYCYATSDFERSRRHRRSHDPQAPAL